MRYARTLSLLALLVFLPTSLSAAPPRNDSRADRIVKMVKVVKRFIVSIQSRITIPIGDEPPPPPPPDNP